MKQGKLIRRAVSAALAGCMMFTLSVPALAESTDALMQLRMTRRSAVSVLDAENSGTDAMRLLLRSMALPLKSMAEVRWKLTAIIATTFLAS